MLAIYALTVLSMLVAMVIVLIAIRFWKNYKNAQNEAGAALWSRNLREALQEIDKLTNGQFEIRRYGGEVRLTMMQSEKKRLFVYLSPHYGKEISMNYYSPDGMGGAMIPVDQMKSEIDRFFLNPEPYKSPGFRENRQR